MVMEKQWKTLCAVSVYGEAVKNTVSVCAVGVYGEAVKNTVCCQCLWRGSQKHCVLSVFMEIAKLNTTHHHQGWPGMNGPETDTRHYSS